MFSKNVLSEARSRGRLTRRWSISKRLAVLYAMSSLMMLVVATGFLYWSLVQNLKREENVFLANKIQECRRLVRGGQKQTGILTNEVQAEAAASQFIKYFVRLTDERGEVVLATPGMDNYLTPATFPSPISARETPLDGTKWKSKAGLPYLLMSAFAETDDGAINRRILQVALDVSVDEALLAGYREKLLTIIAIGIFFCGGLGVIVARHGLRPLDDIATATERITANQLHERIAPTGWPEELASLSRSFDRMLDRLEDSFTRLSQFSADLAHELRTPINNLRGEAGVALSKLRTPEEYRGVLESSLEEYARLSRLIENLLFLARSDAPTTNINRSRFDARQSIEAVRDYYEAMAEDRGIEVTCEGKAEVDADPALFRQAINNLLSNALNSTQRGGGVCVTALQCKEVVEISVKDTGCGIASEHLPKIFDRLYRIDPARSQHPNGSGLGLAIVRSIMRLHGGTVSVESEIAKGSTFILRFPKLVIDAK